MNARELVELMAQLCREHPNETLARVRINNGEWQWMPGGEFVELWSTPFAGSIYIDRVVFGNLDTDRFTGPTNDARSQASGTWKARDGSQEGSQ